MAIAEIDTMLIFLNIEKMTEQVGKALPVPVNTVAFSSPLKVIRDRNDRYVYTGEIIYLRGKGDPPHGYELDGVGLDPDFDW